MPLTIRCPQCKGLFVRHRSDQRFCGAECRSRAHYEEHRERIKRRAKIWAAENESRRKATWKARYDANAEEMRARTQRWREQNREHHRTYSREFAKRNPETVRRRQLRKYGITPEEYDRMLRAQAGLCAICHADTPSRRRLYFDVDHCHTTDRVRGLLCEICNRVVGIFADDPERFQRAADYLRRSSHVADPR